MLVKQAIHAISIQAIHAIYILRVNSELAM